MLIGLLQLRNSLQQHAHLYLFSAFVILTWLVWLVKVVLSRRYRPWTAPYAATTSVVIPVVDEPPDLFREVLRRIVDQGPTAGRGRDQRPAQPGAGERVRRVRAGRRVDVDAHRRQAQRGPGRRRDAPSARSSSSSTATRSGRPGTHERADQALRRPRRRRRDDPPADPRARPQAS